MRGVRLASTPMAMPQMFPVFAIEYNLFSRHRIEEKEKENENCKTITPKCYDCN